MNHIDVIDWHNLHGEGWGDLLVPEAYEHPAKVKRALARRIYAHLLERGYIERESVVVDPFAGICGFALHAMQNGLHFIGVELEQPFVDLGQCCDCTGVTREEWIRYQGRLDKVRYRDGRYICPRCIAEAGRILPSLNGQTEMFGLPQTTSYRRNSGRIPRTDPHHYSGNIETWMDLELPGTACIVQGDSRDLAAVLDGAGGLVSSPPYAAGTVHDRGGINATKFAEPDRVGHNSQATSPTGYGDSPGQLAEMPPGDLAAVVSSPPYASSIASDDPDKRGGLFRDPKRRKDKTLTAEYGNTLGQLANLPEGEHSAIVSSPPYADGCAHTGGDDPKPEHIQGGKLYGVGIAGAVSSHPYAESAVAKNSDGQLAAMPAGDAIVSSPPFEKSMNSPEKCGIDWEKAGRLDRCKPSDARISPQVDGGMAYGETAGQLGTETGTTFWSAAKTIMEQCHQVLAPGAVAVWVLKAFVRDKAIVDFPGQWKRLGESCGFTTIEVIRAHLVEDRGTQYDLWGNAEKREVKRMSFFRRLHSQKFPHLSIDYEVVLIQQKKS